MRCRAEVPASWPSDEAWQRTWRTMVAPLIESRVGPDGHLDLPWPEPVRLVGGTHLATGATYGIAEDRLHQGDLTAAIEGGDRTIRTTWSPRAGRGRAEVRVNGLDRCSRLRARSSLKHLEGELELAPQPADLVRLHLRLDWLAVEFTARVTTAAGSDRLVCDLAVRGVGLWRPTLAPILAALHGPVTRSLDETARDLARSLAEVAGTDGPGSARAAAAEAAATIQLGMDQIAERLRAVADIIDALPWWRGTARRWQQELAALPGVRRPSTAVLVTAQRWSEMEQTALETLLREWRWRRRGAVATVVGQLAAAELEYRRLSDEHGETVQRETAAEPAEPWLSDANLDTRWLATPWRAVRHLLSLSSDAEAKRTVGQFVADAARR